MRISVRRTVLLSVLATGALLASGCFLFPGGTKKGGSGGGGGGGGGGGSASSGSGMADVDAAKAKGDINTLVQICTGHGKITVLDAACLAAIDYYKQRKDMAYLQKICNGSGEFRKWRKNREACKARGEVEDQVWMAELGDCEKMKTIWKRHSDRFLMGKRDPEGSRERMTTVLKAYLKCNMWDTIWTKTVHLGKHSGAGGVWVLGKLTELGQDMYAELWKYLKANETAPFKFKYGHYAVGNVVKWLIKAGKTQECAKFIPIAKASTKPAQAEWIWYFWKSNCKKAQKWLLTQLAHSDSGRRRYTCFVLGHIGNKRAIRKLRILARTDPAYRMRRFTRIYFVRDACKQAIGRIKLRD